jgi:predicted enzyme related to lactoylglutathione lyase
MGDRDGFPPGAFCWADLGTTDAAGAKAFYAALFGWEASELPIRTGVEYTMMRLRGRDAAALYEQEAQEMEAGIPPHWSSYIAVVDVDEVAARVADLGGKLLVGPFDVYDSGRMAVIGDPSGAIVSLWQAGEHAGAGVVDEPGALVWNDLATPAPEAAAAFYGELLGWEFEPVGADYWTIANEGAMNGGIRRETEQPPHWLPWFGVDTIEAAAARATAAGGQVLVAGHDLPPGGRLAMILDPQSAPFAVYEGAVADE